MNKTIFFGDSIIEFFPLDHVFKAAINRGYAGYTTLELKAFIPDVIRQKPKRLIYLAGTNDFNEYNKRLPLAIATTIQETLAMIQKACPDCDIILCSLLPCDHTHIDMHTMNRGIRTNEMIQALNTLLSQLPYHYLDLFSLFYDGQVARRYYVDSLHVNEEGYALIAEKIKEALISY